MNIVMTWVVGLMTISMIILFWYVTQPMIVQTTNVSDSVLDSIGTNTSGWEQTKIINIYVANFWPVPFIIAVLMWMFISSQRTDPESVMYR